MSQDSQLKNWYASWFDTPFYHILYQDRDYHEAERFMVHLTHHLQLDSKARILDLACGRGRHSIHLAQLGYNVCGLDLSPKSISYANNLKTEANISNVKFIEGDMTKPTGQYFDAVFNLFTSMGYFDKEEDNQNTLHAIKGNLKENGVAVIDFMNVDYVIPNLVAQDAKLAGGIIFNQMREFKNGHIFKRIQFEYEEGHFEFTERVRALNIDDFKRMIETAGMSIIDTFGDYELNPFDRTTSSRLILTFK